MKVHVLGCGSATPTVRHNPSCQVVEHRGTLYMIDCGEGAQVMMRRCKLSFSKLRHVFISHAHGDHCLGLPGLLSTLALHDIGGTLTVHAFEETLTVLRQMYEFFCKESSLTIEWAAIPEGERTVVLDTRSLTVEAFPLYHRVPTSGFLFRQKSGLRHLRGDLADFYHVPHYMRGRIKEGEDFVTEDGVVIPNERLTTDPSPAVSYAYCSDTTARREVVEAVRGVTLLYHEATYGDDCVAKAVKHCHSTARQAGRIAAESEVGALMIGHYSKRYDRVDELVAQAEEEFHGPVIAADEGLTVDIEKLLG